jgi:hypothetical protein
MVLSGVARTQARPFSCGRTLIVQMLCGSASAKVARLGLSRLSTFGLLGHLKQDEVGSLIDALIEVHCLRQVDVNRYRPVLELTDLGAEVMHGTAGLSGPLPLPPQLLFKLGGWEKPGTGASADRGPLPEVAKPDMEAPPASAPPAHYWTRRLLAAGFSVDECAAIRRLPRDVILDHARRADG